MDESFNRPGGANILLRNQRLDLAARGSIAAESLSRMRVVTSGFSVVIIALGTWGTDSYYDPLVLHVLAAMCAAFLVAGWLPWRNKNHAMAIAPLIWALGFGLARIPRPNTISGWELRIIEQSVYAFWFWRLWRFADAVAVVHGDGWRNERAQIDQWLSELKSRGGTEVVEFSAGSFWTGYWTFRVLKSADCWVIAKFKTGSEKLLDCRVRNLNEVVFTAMPSGKWNIEITEKKRSFAEVELTPQLPGTFQPDTLRVDAAKLSR